MEKGRIVKGTGGLYSVEVLSCGNLPVFSIIECRAKGSFRKDKIVPVPGDFVLFEPIKEGGGFIIEIEKRKNFLVRPQSANIDSLIIVAAAANPDTDLYLLDKMLCVAVYNNIEVLLAVSKSDIENPRKLCGIYRNSGFKTTFISSKIPEEYSENLDYIKNFIKGKTCFFTGTSGVGKSSLINCLFPDLNLQTNTLSKKINRGRHTTRCTELYKISDDTYIADTPGFSMLEIAKFNLIPKEHLLSSFPDIEKYSHSCKYSDCTHICEDGCSVLSAVDSGKIEKTRHESFKNLYFELKNKNTWD